MRALNCQRVHERQGVYGSIAIRSCLEGAATRHSASFASSPIAGTPVFPSGTQADFRTAWCADDDGTLPVGRHPAQCRLAFCSPRGLSYGHARDNQRLDGELFVTPGPGEVHQDIAGELHALLREYRKGHGVSRAMISPAEVRRGDRTRNRHDLQSVVEVASSINLNLDEFLADARA